MEKIGLIAGNRRFPILFADAAAKRGYCIVAAAIKGDTSPALRKHVHKMCWFGLDEFSRMLRTFKDEGITQVVMAGQISPHRLFSKEVYRSGELKDLLAGIKDKKADTVFGALAEKLKTAGLELLDSTMFIEEFLPQKGVLTKRSPTFGEWEDVYFGLELAKAIGYLDVGQAVAVKDKAVLAVEALEGTDNLIRRAGRFPVCGVVVVKVSKPKQDMRFDIPVVGLNTIKNLIRIKAACLAIEAGKTLFIDKPQSIKLGDDKGLSIVAL